MSAAARRGWGGPLAVVVALASAACASSMSTTECHVGADCASGVCSTAGKCEPAPEAGVDAGLDAAVEAATHTDSGSGHPDAAPGGDASTGCQPNGDGVISRAEVPMLAGLHASFVVAENVTMNTAGTANPDGSRTWDFSAALSGDHTIVVTTDAPTGQWFSAQFPQSTYTSKLSDTSSLLGIFQATGASLLLQGVATPTSNSPQTQVTYTPAAEVLAVPMQMGTTWTSTSTVQGTADGITSYYTEQYASKVDAHGSLKVPYGTFKVLRVQTTLTRTVGALVTLTQSLTFVAECFGPVAALTSTSDETSTEFTSVAEARRLTQ